MPLTPEEASAAQAQPDPLLALLYEEIDKQLARRGRAIVWKLTATYGEEALHITRQTYEGLGWKVRYQAEGQFDVQESLVIEKE